MTRYEVRGWLKMSEEDTYAEGCLIDGGTQFSGSDTWYGETVDAVIEQLRQFVPFKTDGDAIDRDACDEPGRIDISGTETNDGDEPTPAQWEAWKRGEYRLWYVTYIFHVERVTRETVSATV